MSYQNLLYSVDDRVATVTLNRPSATTRSAPPSSTRSWPR